MTIKISQIETKTKIILKKYERHEKQQAKKNMRDMRNNRLKIHLFGLLERETIMGQKKQVKR